ADKRFSRPPRYDHFDISPSVSRFLNGKSYSNKKPLLCQPLSFIFFIFSKKRENTGFSYNS
ncbi:MAG: hypothetical protein ACI4E2_08280, partial [Acetatifactor sp.]